MHLTVRQDSYHRAVAKLITGLYAWPGFDPMHDYVIVDGGSETDFNTCTKVLS